MYHYLYILLFAGAAYLIGSISSAIITCRIMGLEDPRKTGSHNPGATNVLRHGGKKAAIITLLGDMLKGLIPVLLAVQFQLEAMGIALVGLSALLGHVFPVYYGFKGGKGAATLIGTLLVLAPKLIIGVLLVWAWWDDLLLLANKEALVSIVDGLTLVGWASLLLSSTLILLAVVDVPFQLWEHKRQLKMTQQEVRDEHKETEGRPEVKGRIRQLQREMARRRMMEEVPKADVIVTNPTHYAVALKYDQNKMAAPLLVAKGSDLVAANIRRVGGEHNVPVVEAPLLARAIYFNTELNETIPAGLYLAVAQLLAYVFQLHAYENGSGEVPMQPEEFPVPEDLQHD